MSTKLIWHATELEKEIRAETVKRLKQAAIMVRDAAARKTPVSDKPHTFRGKVYQPGSLKKSWRYRVYSKDLKARVGTDVIYGIFQELGPVMGKKRWKHTPSLRPALHETESQLKDLLGVTSGVSGSSIKELRPTDILLG